MQLFKEVSLPGVNGTEYDTRKYVRFQISGGGPIEKRKLEVSRNNVFTLVSDSAELNNIIGPIWP